MFQYTFDETHNLMIWRQSIEVNLDFMLELLSELQAIEAVRPPFNRFVDFSDATGIALHYEDLRQITQKRAAYEGPNVKSAFFSANPLGFGIARMYQALMGDSPVNVGVFRDVDQCARWLRVPSAVLGGGADAESDSA